MFESLILAVVLVLLSVALEAEALVGGHPVGLMQGAQLLLYALMLTVVVVRTGDAWPLHTAFVAGAAAATARLVSPLVLAWWASARPGVASDTFVVVAPSMLSWSALGGAAWMAALALVGALAYAWMVRRVILVAAA